MRKLVYLLAILAAFAFAAPTLAREQEHGKPAAHETTAGHAEAEHGEAPPLLSFDPGSAVWSIIIFVVLLIVLGKVAWKPILTSLQQRETFITDSIESAKRERENTQKMIREFEEKSAKAAAEATAMIDEARRDAEVARKRIEEEAAKSAEDMLSRAKREIAVAKDSAVKELYERTLDLATTTAGKIVRKQLSPQDHRALLDESLAELSKVQN